MNRRTGSTLTMACLLLLWMGGLAACDSASPSDEVAQELQLLESTLTQELSLSASQQQDLGKTMRGFGGRDYEPGVLWELAAELQATLTDEQKARLFDRTGRMERNNMCPTPRFGQSGFGWRGLGHGGGCLSDVLTDEQTGAVEALREGYRDQLGALRESKRNEEISQEDFRAAIQEIHDTIQAAIDALLTDEQRDALAACRADRRAEREATIEAFRAADREAMSDVLGLSASEADAVFALMDEHKADVEALFEQLEEESIDCEAFQETITALKEAFDEALQDVLDDTQWEIVQIHRAIARRGRPFGHRLGMGVFGGFGGFGLLSR